VRGLAITHPAVGALNNTYERALVSMHKMPRIWLEYLEFLTEQRLVTKARRVFDRALCALPITQHDRIWVLYLVPTSSPPPTPRMMAVHLFIPTGNLCLYRRPLPGEAPTGGGGLTPFTKQSRSREQNQMERGQWT
jgi:hypothetical protein